MRLPCQKIKQLNTFRVQFIIGQDKQKDDKAPLYCRITVNAQESQEQLSELRPAASQFRVRHGTNQEIRDVQNGFKGRVKEIIYKGG